MTKPTPHGQVPEALRLADALEASHSPFVGQRIVLCDSAAELRRLHARIAELEAQIEALSGVQALSAAPEAVAKLRHLYQNMVNGAVRDTASAKRIAEGLLAPVIEALERATPPAEQQTTTKAAPGEPPGIQALMCVISSLHSLRDTAHFSDEEGELTNDLCTLRDWAYAQTAAFQPSPTAQAAESRTIPDREIPGIVEKALQELEGLVKYATSTYGHWHMRRAKEALSDLEWWARRKLAAHAQAAESVPAPLSDAQIAELMRDTWGCASIAPRLALEFARAVVRAAIAAQGGKDA